MDEEERELGGEGKREGHREMEIWVRSRNYGERVESRQRDMRKERERDGGKEGEEDGECSGGRKGKEDRERAGVRGSAGQWNLIIK